LRSPDPTPAEQFERADLVRRVRDGIGRLGERDALVLSLYYIEELNYVEIGQVLDVSESRVCQLHSRALARLRVALDEPPAKEACCRTAAIAGSRAPARRAPRYTW